ncbi:MAG TPA: hypothetical protein VFE23_06725 [Usitatibacter sp.]|jgi:hypothetical protein|nr:hypothetical protein [Usitatibacter sp.]
MPRSAASPEELNADTVARLLAAAQRRPQLADIPWHDDEATFDAAQVLRDGAARLRTAPARPGPAPAPLDTVRHRIRDRYISVRFAGLARGAADLENPTRVIKAAWLVYEDGEAEAALELLRLAIEQNDSEITLRLAELDLSCRARDGERFGRAAQGFREHFPDSPEWPEVARVGRRLAPGDSLFAPSAGKGADDGPELPRWIQSPWEAAPAVDAVEFHRAMTAEAHRGH